MILIKTLVIVIMFLP